MESMCDEQSQPKQIPLQLQYFVVPLPVCRYTIKRSFRRIEDIHKTNYNLPLCENSNINIAPVINTFENPCFELDYGNDASVLDVIGCNDLLITSTLVEYFQKQYKQFRFKARTFLKKISKKFNIPMDNIAIDYHVKSTEYSKSKDEGDENNTKKRDRRHKRDFTPKIIPISIMPLLIMEIFLTPIGRTIIMAPLILVFNNLITQFEGTVAKNQLNVALYNMMVMDHQFQKQYIGSHYRPTFPLLQTTDVGKKNKNQNNIAIKRRKIDDKNTLVMKFQQIHKDSDSETLGSEDSSLSSYSEQSSSNEQSIYCSNENINDV